MKFFRTSIYDLLIEKHDITIHPSCGHVVRDFKSEAKTRGKQTLNIPSAS